MCLDKAIITSEVCQYKVKANKAVTKLFINIHAPKFILHFPTNEERKYKTTGDECKHLKFVN